MISKVVTQNDKISETESAIQFQIDITFLILVFNSFNKILTVPYTYTQPNSRYVHVTVKDD